MGGNMIDLVSIVIVALLAFVLTGIVAWRYRGGYAPVSWFGFLAMSLGSFAVAAFYSGIIYIDYADLSKGFLLPALRLLFLFVVAVTSMIGLGTLLVKHDE